jgi:SAM-dependent methyltransferase
MFVQTWWNEKVEKNIETFNGWVGDYKAESKLYMGNYLKSKNYASILDAGCANASFLDTLKYLNINMTYVGVDSCKYFVSLNNARSINTIESDITKMCISDKSYDIVFSRHTFEHQPHFQPILLELIRVAKNEACHIFFIKPAETELINYSQDGNLFHNRYSIEFIEDTLKNNTRVESWKWVEINQQECALHVYLKE